MEKKPHKSIAIIQSNYIPWKGYFDIINMADEFILLDDVQYTRRDWRNRNLIKTVNGLKWLTIPVSSKGNYIAPINQITTANQHWRKQHWNSIVHSYSKSKYFHLYFDRFRSLYLDSDERFLSKVNEAFIKEIASILGITTKISWSETYEFSGNKSQKLLCLCKRFGATKYISGPSAKGYLNEGTFKEGGVEVEWMTYSGYPEYHQLFGPFEHKVSILDLIFNEGPQASNYMKSFKK